MEDDWNPSFKVESILQKTVIKMDNKTISNKVMKFNEKADEFKADEDSQGQQENMMFDVKQIKAEKTAETLYDPLKDDRCESWVVRKMHGSKQFQKPISCPGCFTPICYKYTTNDTQYSSKQAVNVEIDYNNTVQMGDNSNVDKMDLSTLQKMPVSQLDSVEQALKRQYENFNVYFSTVCRQCQNQVGLYDFEGKTYYFFGVI